MTTKKNLLLNIDSVKSKFLDYRASFRAEFAVSGEVAVEISLEIHDVKNMVIIDLYRETE